MKFLQLTSMVAVLLSVGLVAAGCNKDTEAAPDGSTRPTPSVSSRATGVTRVETAVVRPSAAELVIQLPGEVEASRDANLASSLGGFIEKVNVEAGDTVEKGQVLALVDTTSHQVRRNQAKVELDTAKLELDRAKKLGDALPAAQLDAAQARYDAARAAYLAADLQVARSVISAPFSGTVARCDAEVGEVASPGMPLIRVVQLDPVKVTVSLSDRDVINVKKGMKASVTTDARIDVIHGEVSHVRPAADLNTRAFTAEIKLENADDNLRPGMIANVQIQTEGQGDKQLVIPQDWLVTKPSQLGVFLNDGGVARWRTVEAGSVVRNQVVILKGLSAGDELVIKGHRELADGDSLIVARKGICCQEGRVVFDGAPSLTPKAGKSNGSKPSENGPNHAADETETAKSIPKR
ncbi:MAG TPA: efflux RND transporter periplasmic adaptor subunit [Polyangiaceae bacterium]|nr:efflux RND transporter periplasmic adaptor subunit [Polyangiaceae bacterium]